MFWNKKVLAGSKTDDPLGFLRKIKNRFFDTLFLGLTKPVYNAKYYSLYPTFLQFLIENNSLTRKNISVLDKAFLVTAKEVVSSDYLGLLGITSLKNVSETEMYSLNFDIFKNGGLGFDKMLGSLINLNLVKESKDTKKEIPYEVTTIGRSFIKFSCLKNQTLNILNNPSDLINCLREDIYLKDSEKELLRRVFLGEYEVGKNSDAHFATDVDFRFDYSELNKSLNEKSIAIYNKLRHYTIEYWTSIFKEGMDYYEFVLALLKDVLYKRDEKFDKIRKLWKLYFVISGYEYVNDLTMYYFYETVRKKWDGISSDVSVSFNDLPNLMSYKEHNFSSITFENLSKDIRNNLNDLATLPSKIKQLYKQTVDLFRSLDDALFKLFVKFEKIKLSTTYGVERFIDFYQTNRSLDDKEFILKFFREFCLLRQGDIIRERGYFQKDEKILFIIYQDGISTSYERDKTFYPKGVFDHSKLENALRILADIDILPKLK